MKVLTENQGFLAFQLPESNQLKLLVGQWTSEPTNENHFVIANHNGKEKFYLNGIPSIISSDLLITNNRKSNELASVTQEEYIHKANSFIQACNQELNKVILSRTKIQAYSTGNYYPLFAQLCDQYPKAFNYIINIPEVGMWMGATPELLLSRESNTYKTVALAGSQPYDQFKENGWKTKEQEEQQYVTDYIKSILESLDIAPDISQPYTIKAGKIAHIKTDFSFTSTRDSQQLISRLHPTPAVCGVPKQKAETFIAKNEGYNREFYTGYLGICSKETESYFVNLRCMQVHSNQVKLYIGGGITNKSNPQKEWQETELKSQTLLSILKSE